MCKWFLTNKLSSPFMLAQQDSMVRINFGFGCSLVGVNAKVSLAVNANLAVKANLGAVLEGNAMANVAANSLRANARARG